MRQLGGGLSALLCLAAAALGLTACGSSGSDFADEADAVCKQAAVQSVAIFESPAASAEDQQGAIKVQQRYLALDEKKNRELKALDPPSGAQKAFDAFREAGESATANDKKLLAAAEAGNPQRYQELSEKGEKEGEAADKAAAAVGGLEACANELPAAEAEELTQTIEKNEMEANPAQCTDWFTELAVKQQWRTVKGCREFQENESKKELPDSVDVKVTDGVEGVRATADVTFHGGHLDGETIELGLAHEKGAWMVVFGKPTEAAPKEA